MKIVDKSVDIVPGALYEELVGENCVLFVGAGVTTEGSGYYSRPSFYKLIEQKLKNDHNAGLLPFPDLMQHFCNHIDGGQRNRLIGEAIRRIEAFSVPGEKQNEATEFARALAKIPYFNRIVTTNWDPFVERSLGILIPMIEDRDIPFWDDGKRQILKIHGCITRPYTLVATRDDYNLCMKQRPLVFSKLRDLMATKTVIFAGYSMKDSDFRIVLDEIVRALGRLRKLAYWVDPNADGEKSVPGETAGIQVIRTSGVDFLNRLLRKLEQEDLVPSRRFLRFLHRERGRIARIHFELHQDEDGAVASAMYQDGLLHALGDVLTQASLGTKAEDYQGYLGQREHDLGQMFKKRNIIEIAYVSGWCEIYRRFCQRADSAIPPYFHPYKFTPTARYVKGHRFPAYRPVTPDKGL
jgi:hypothetical protein